MTEKEELKRDLITREIGNLHSHVMAKYESVLEHLNNVTSPGCVSAEDKSAAGFAIRQFLHHVRDAAVMLDRLQKKL